MTVFLRSLLAFIAIGTAIAASAGPLDPDCTPEKAAKGAATKAAIGVGGRCSVAETAKDSAKRSAGVKDKGPIEKHTSKDGPLDKVKKSDK